jgi:flagellin
MSVINTNIAATMTANSMRENQRTMENTMERLATGKRINSASDDAAGLAIETRMDSQIRGLSQASRNANDGISLLQTADGAASEMNDMLQRMRELSVQAQNGTVGTQDVSNLNQEFAALATEIDRIANDTTFNNINILSSSQQINITVGADEADVIAVNLVDFNLGAGRGGSSAAVAQVYEFGTVEDDAEALALTGTATFTVANGGTKSVVLDMDSDNMKTVGQMVTAINNNANFGAGVAGSYTAGQNESGGLIMTANAAGATFSTLGGLAKTSATAGTDAVLSNAKAATFSIGIVNNAGATALADGATMTLTSGSKSVTITGASSGASKTDTVAEMVALINDDVNFGAGVAGSYTASLVGGTGTDTAIVMTANEVGTSTADLTLATASLGAGTVPALVTIQAADDGAGTPMGADLSNFAKTTVTDSVGTAGVLAKIDNAIEGIATARASFGATINRLEYTVDNLNTTILNTKAAKSQIVDADYAAETTELARTQIISQASTAMLSQANQQAQSVLALLK